MTSGAEVRTGKSHVGKPCAVGAAADGADLRLDGKLLHGLFCQIDQVHVWLNLLLHVVVGVPDEILGNRICAFIMPEDDQKVDLLMIHQFLKKMGVASYKMPDQVERIDFWPLTSVQKIDKKALVLMAQEK